MHKQIPSQISLQFFPLSIIPPMLDTHLTFSILLIKTKRAKPGGPFNKSNALQEIEQHEERKLLSWNFQVSEKFLSFKCSQVPLFCSLTIKSFPSGKLIKPNSRIFVKSL